jgi:peptidoglycan/xylan/chitin deacetylase (PgdA/CDA1 family)/glycosyltransferase involved in cell wall biosynthesis
MNILHVLSQFEVTGAESYAVTLMDEQVRSGHSATVVSDTLTLPTSAAYIPVPIGRRSYKQRLRNIITLIRLIRDQSIDVVHAHSRAASWVSWFATGLTGTAFVSTIHGRQHVHTSSKSFSIYGRRIIAVSSALKEHLIKDLGIPARSIEVIPNCISFDQWDRAKHRALKEQPATPGKEEVILFVGRLTGPKGDVVRLLLKSVLPDLMQCRPVQFRAIGGMITPDDIPSLASTLNATFSKPRVELLGFQENVAAEILKATIVVGSGRVVPESLSLGKPVLAFGESNYIGPVTASIYNLVAETNFGDTGVPTPVDPERVTAELIRMLDHPLTTAELACLSELSRQRFDARVISHAVLSTYERAFAETHSPNSIPVLMYHRVLPDSAERPSHGIWVTGSMFARQLASLHRRGFEAITFLDYALFLQGKKPLPRRPIILTFDDGYGDNYDVAFPLLQKWGFKAVVYVVTDRERRTNFWDKEEPPASLLTPSQLMELHRSGMEIGSHTVTHARLTEVSADFARNELINSKKNLEEMLGAEVPSFAYPYGSLDARVKEMVEEAGYKFAVAADTGPTALCDDLLEIRRTQVFPWTGTAGFWKKTLPLYHRYKRLKTPA